MEFNLISESILREHAIHDARRVEHETCSLSFFFERTLRKILKAYGVPEKTVELITYAFGSLNTLEGIRKVNGSLTEADFQQVYQSIADDLERVIFRTITGSVLKDVLNGA